VPDISHVKEILVVAGTELIPVGCNNPLELIKFMIVTDTRNTKLHTARRIYYRIIDLFTWAQFALSQQNAPAPRDTNGSFNVRFIIEYMD
jgi:hypothetical protein